MLYTVPSFEFVVKKVLNNYRKSILSYSTAQSFRSLSRSNLENAATICEILLRRLNHSSEEYDGLKLLHNQHTEGKRFVCISSGQDFQSPVKLTISLADNNETVDFLISPRENQLISEKLDYYLEKLRVKKLKDDVAGGLVILPVSLEEFKNNYKTKQVKLTLRQNHDKLDPLFDLMKNFPNDIYKRYLLKYWDFSKPERLDVFKRYLYKHFKRIDSWNFSEIMCKAKHSEEYRECLIIYSQDKNVDIFDRLCVAEPDMGLIKRYQQIWISSGKDIMDFFWKGLYCTVCKKNKSGPLREIYDYLCDMINIPRTGSAIIDFGNQMDKCTGYGDWHSISYALFSTGYLTWTTDDYHQHKLKPESIGDEVLVVEYERWMKETNQVVVPLSIVCNIKTIKVVHKKKGDKINILSSEDPDWLYSMEALWNSILNWEDRPVKANDCNQFPLCKIYENKFAIDSYLGFEDLIGSSSKGIMYFGDSEELEVQQSLIWGLCDFNEFISLLKSELLKLGYKIEL